MGEHRMLPIRWMAPETIRYTCQKFSSASDVWAYGVTIWEIFTFGQRPYFSLSNQEVLIKVSEGLTLEPPNNCPNEVRNVMQSCWSLSPEHRCSFEDIVETLEKSQSDCNDFINPSYDLFKTYETPTVALTVNTDARLSASSDTTRSKSASPRYIDVNL